MFEAHISSVISWFTPTVLFLFLNLTIGTIAVASSFAARKHRHNSEPCSFIVRSPSFLHRLQSFSFSSSVEKTPGSETHESKQERGEDEDAMAMNEMTRKIHGSASANTSSGEDNAGAMNEDKEGLAMEDEEVDAKADDFINKFKQQLKLQRLESIMR